MKRSELVFTLALVPLDFLALTAAGITAFYARFHPFFTAWRPVIFDLTIERYVTVVIPIALVWILIFAASGLYSTHPRRIASELTRVFLACSTAMAAVFAILFFSRVLFESRFIAVAAWVLAILFVSLARLVIRLLQRALLSYGIGERRVVVVGSNKTTEALL
jgi:FlaA1/EpsC-like NDP-sugar epimerase